MCRLLKLWGHVHTLLLLPKPFISILFQVVQRQFYRKSDILASKIKTFSVIENRYNLTVTRKIKLTSHCSTIVYTALVRPATESH